jgi:hypothetical protein
MTISDNSDVTFADERAATIDRTKQQLRDERKTIDTLMTAYSASKGTAPGNVSQFLRGVMCGLRMGEFAVEDMNTSIMREPDPAAKEALDDE